MPFDYGENGLGLAPLPTMKPANPTVPPLQQQPMVDGGLRQGMPQGYWQTQSAGSGADYFDQGNQPLAIANTTPEMLSSMGFKGPGIVNQGTGQNLEQVVNPDIYQYLKDNNLQYGQRYTGENDNSFVNQVFDKGGKPIEGATSTWKNGNDDAFEVAMLLASALAGGAAAGVGASGAGAGAEAAGGIGSAGAAGATNPALIDSYLGTAGYGASSAGAGGGAGAIGGLGEIANTGSDAHFYNNPTAAEGGLGNMGGAGTATIPSMTLGQGGSGLGNLLRDVGKTIGGGGQNGSGQGGNLLALFGGGGMSAGDRYRQQLLAQSLRDNVQQPQQQMPGWIPGG